ncbi:MAG: thioredoxin fold domain-containing protein [Bacteroidota bacterium]
MIRISSLLLFAFLFSYSALSAKKAPLFKVSTIQEMQAQAHANYQLYFVYVYQDGSRAAKRMSKRTWKDEGLQSYIRKNHLALALDANDPTTPVEFIQKYKVYSYPTLLIFSPEGKIMGRTEGYVAPETVFAVLNKHEKTLEQKRRTAFMAFEAQPVMEKTVMAMAPVQQVSRGMEASAPKAQPNVRDLRLPEVKPTNVRDLSPDAAKRMAAPGASVPVMGVSRGQSSSKVHLEVPGLEAYSLRKLDVNLEEADKGNIGLLVGTYTNYKKAKNEVKQLERFWRGDLWVYCEEIDAVPVYKVVLGNYPTREKAQSFAQAMYKVQRLQSSLLDLALIR